MNDEDINYTTNEYEFIFKVIAEWTFRRSIDLIKGGIRGENRDYILQKMAYTIFEVVKEYFKRKIELQTILGIVEYNENNAYQETLKELYSEGKISFERYNSVVKYSNIDDMPNEHNENHSSFYSTDEKADSDCLQIRLYIFMAKSLHINTL